jgi:uncharacterized protein (TIGR02301 family)
MVKALRLLICLGAVMAPLGAGAQEATPTLKRGQGESTEARLMQLSQILGALHYVRKLCAPSDGDFWRDRMMEMIRLEKPSVAEREQLIQQFNVGYDDATSRFPTCTADARSFASDTAKQGEKVALGIANSINMGNNPG